MADLRQYSEQTDREIRAVLERHRQSRTFDIGPRNTELSDSPRLVRWVRTCVNLENPIYPTPPANKFVIEFGELAFSDANVINETATFEANSPRETRVAYSHYGWIPNQTVCRATLHKGLWFIETDYRPDPTRIKIKNTEAYTMVAGYAWEIGTANITPTQASHGELYFNAAAPTTAGSVPFAVTESSIAAGEIGSAIVSGAAFVYFHVSKSYYTHAKILGGGTAQMEGGLHGWPIVWKSASTGTIGGVVLLGGNQFCGPFDGVAATGIASGSSADVNVWWNGVVTTGPDTVTVYNDFAEDSRNIDSNDEIRFTWQPDRQKYVAQHRKDVDT